MNSKQYPKFTLLLTAAFCIVNVQAALWLEYELAGFDNIDSPLFQTDLRSKRYDKTSFGISGIVDVKKDFSNDYEFNNLERKVYAILLAKRLRNENYRNCHQVELLLFHSAKGNNQFVKLPYKVARDGVCNIVDGIYVKSKCAKDVAAASDLPEPVPNESLCAAYKAGNYTIKQYILGKDVIPKFFQAGYYKAQIIVYPKDSEESSMFTLHVKLY